MEEIKVINEIRKAASVLKDSKLKRMEKAAPAAEVHFDRFDLCEIVDGLLSSRQNGEIRTADIFSNVARIENAHPDMEFIREVRELLPDVKDRTLFYEICKGYNPTEDESTEINVTLEQIYERIPDRAAVKRAILNGTHPIMTAGLADLENNAHLPLSDKGISLYFKELAATMMPDDTCEDRFAFVGRIADEVSEGTYGPSMSEANKLYSAVKRIESHTPGDRNRQHQENSVRSRRPSDLLPRLL